MKRQSLEDIKSKLEKLAPKYGISYLGVFGSYACGEQDEKSDLDLLVKFSKSISLLDFVGVEQGLGERLGVKVDLLTENSISPYIKPYINKELVKVYETTNDR